MFSLLLSVSMSLVISGCLIGEGGGSIRKLSKDSPASCSAVSCMDFVGVKSRSSWSFDSSILRSTSPKNEAIDRFARDIVLLLDATDELGDGNMFVP